MNKKEELLICECSSAEHQLIIQYFPDDKDSEVYVTMHLSPKNIWKRIKHAILYIFGYKCRYGAFEEIILNQTHISSLNKVIDHIKSVEAKKQQLKLFDN